MPKSIAFDWRLIAYSVAMLLALTILERIKSQRLPFTIWRLAWCQAILVIIASSIELIPYYCWGVLLPSAMRHSRNLAAVIVLTTLVLLYARLSWMMRRGRRID